MRLCRTANQCQTRRVDLTGQRGGEAVPHVSGALTMHVLLFALPSPYVDYVPLASPVVGVLQGLHRCGCQLLSSSSRARFHLIIILVSPCHNMSEIAALTANDFLLVAVAVCRNSARHCCIRRIRVFIIGAPWESTTAIDRVELCTTSIAAVEEHNG